MKYVKNFVKGFVSMIMAIVTFVVIDSLITKLSVLIVKDTYVAFLMANPIIALVLTIIGISLLFIMYKKLLK